MCLTIGVHFIADSLFLGSFRERNFNIFIFRLTNYFLYHAFLIHFTLASVKKLELSRVSILLEHPVIFKVNITNKNNNINFFNSITSNFALSSCFS